MSFQAILMIVFKQTDIYVGGNSNITLNELDFYYIVMPVFTLHMFSPHKYTGGNKEIPTERYPSKSYLRMQYTYLRFISHIFRKHFHCFVFFLFCLSFLFSYII